ncbi:MAG: glcD [Firmicutes bacterium]|nr:glcD [Bacillota bacterium]
MAFLDELQDALGLDYVRTRLPERMAYAYDATGEKHPPDAVAMPGSAEQVLTVLRIARKHGVPVVARGAGTNLSGGTLPVQGGLVLNLLRMNRILNIDVAGRRAEVEPGLVNGRLNDALRPLGFHYAPDPSSMKVSTIGGNIAENAGGPHCLKYGVTASHVLGLQLATSEGELVDLTEADAYDLRGLVVGSEGTLGIVTRATLRITPLPRAARTLMAAFPDLDRSCQTVAGIIAAQIIPAALELMDRVNLELTTTAGFGHFPPGTEAALIIEVDGDPEDIAEEAAHIAAICHSYGATEVRSAADEQERNQIWLGRRNNYGYLARTSPFVWTQDVTVPRNHLAQMLREVLAIGERHGLPINTVAHAGDGNLHPTIPFDPKDPVQREQVRQADLEILAACVRLGGSISGEHGIGIDKLAGMPLMFTPAQLDLMGRIRRVFDPECLLNPGTLLPAPKGGF